MTPHPEDMPEGWIRAMVGGVRRSQILHPTGPPLGDLGRPMVNLVCISCGERLGMVTEEVDGPWLTVWSPTIMRRRANAPGEPFWTLQAGVLPADDEELFLHCFTHGGTGTTGAVLRAKVKKYRIRGRTERLRVTMPHR